MESSPAPTVSCVSLGMFIIDEIQIPERPPLTDILGGSAAFVTLGQRLFAKPASEVGCLVIAGDDFPQAVREAIEGWGTTLVVKNREGENSTRGRLVYEDNTFGPKTFTYIGEPLRTTLDDLIGTPLLGAKAFHFFGSPSEVMTYVPELLELRAANGISERPFIVWEPLPSSCIRSNQQSFKSAFRLVDVFSPNHIEMAAIFQDMPIDGFDYHLMRKYAQDMWPVWFSWRGSENSLSPESVTRRENRNMGGIVLIRAAEHGALSVSASSTSSAVWLPSFYEKGAAQVVDATGAGNTFLGGFIAGWLQTGQVKEAMQHGNVAASFALEQIGLPNVEERDGRVVCNGVGVLERLQEYNGRLSELPGLLDRNIRADAGTRAAVVLCTDTLQIGMRPRVE